MGRYLYDIETDGLLDNLTRIHSLVMKDIDSGTVISVAGHETVAMLAAVKTLNDAELRVGHNIIKFDEPALEKVFPGVFKANPCHTRIRDTLVLTRLIWSNLKDIDLGRRKRNPDYIPGQLIGAHSLEAWGIRLGEWKGDYADVAAERLMDADPKLKKSVAKGMVWETWSQEMQDYCVQDVAVTEKLWDTICRKGYAARAIEDETETAIVCAQIERNGFPFKEREAGELYARLVGERLDLEAQLEETFGSWVVNLGETTPVGPNASLGYWGEAYYALPCGSRLEPDELTPKGLPNAAAKRSGARRVFEGFPYTRIDIVKFNPSSRQHIAARLKALHGWEPTEFTPDGQAKVDEDVLGGLPYPEAQLLTRYFLVQKRIGQLAEGRQAWLKKVRGGKIHGSINTNAAVTRRCTHSDPNVGQVPGVGAEYGPECRDLFWPGESWLQVGTDLSGIELRALAHYMARWDNGDYVKVLLEGDVHTANQEAAGLPTRAMAKTFIYGFLYGAGDAKIGSIVGQGSKAGKALKAQFLAGLPALGSLLKAVKTKAKHHKHLLALDGGVLHIRSDHAALNTLLQSAGALVAKKWLCMMERELKARGLKHGWDGDYAIMAFVHDELQFAARTQEIADVIRDVSKLAIQRVTEYYQFRCPLDVDTKVGRSWKDCH
jgi:DNA polymerase-1